MAEQTAADIITQQTTQTPDPSKTANPPPAGWWDGVKDQEVKAFLANKAFDSPETLAKAYWSFEKTVGADKAGRTVVLPKDDNDVEGRKAFLSKIGVPEKPEDYKLPLPDGDDGTFAKWATSAFHKAGVPAKAAQAMATEWNAWVGQQVEDGRKADLAKGETEIQALKVEWAHEYDEKAALAKRGFNDVTKLAGWTDEDVKTIESVVGAAKTLRLFSKIGEMTGEAGFAGGGANQGGFGMSAGKAQERYNELIAQRSAGKITDFEWDRGAVKEEMDRLLGILTKKAS